MAHGTTYFVEDCCNTSLYYVVAEDWAYWYPPNGMCGSASYPCGVSPGNTVTFYSADWNDFYCGKVIASAGSRTQVTHSSGNTFEGYENWTTGYVANGEAPGCPACQSYMGASQCPTNYIVEDCCDTSIFYKVADDPNSPYGPFSIGDIISWYGFGKYNNLTNHCGKVVVEDCEACDNTGYTITDPSGQREIQSSSIYNTCCGCRQSTLYGGDNCEHPTGGYTIVDCCDNSITYTAEDPGGYGYGTYILCDGDALDFYTGGWCDNSYYTDQTSCENATPAGTWTPGSGEYYCGTVDLGTPATSRAAIHGQISNSATYGLPPTCAECTGYYCCTDPNYGTEAECEAASAIWDCTIAGPCGGTTTTTTCAPCSTACVTSSGFDLADNLEDPNDVLANFNCVWERYDDENGDCYCDSGRCMYMPISASASVPICTDPNNPPGVGPCYLYYTGQRWAMATMDNWPTAPSYEADVGSELCPEDATWSGSGTPSVSTATCPDSDLCIDVCGEVIDVPYTPVSGAAFMVYYDGECICPCAGCEPCGGDSGLHPCCCANGEVVGANFTNSDLDGTWFTNSCNPLDGGKEGFYISSGATGNYMSWNDTDDAPEGLPAWQIYEGDWMSMNPGNIVAQSIGGSGHAELSPCPYDTTWKETTDNASSWNASSGTVSSGCVEPESCCGPCADVIEAFVCDSWPPVYICDNHGTCSNGAFTNKCECLCGAGGTWVTQFSSGREDGGSCTVGSSTGNTWTGLMKEVSDVLLSTYQAYAIANDCDDDSQACYGVQSCDPAEDQGTRTDPTHKSYMVCDASLPGGGPGGNPCGCSNCGT